MSLCRRILSLLALLFGLIGFAGCIAAVVGVWIVSARLSRTTELVFEKVDSSLVVVRQRVAQTQERVEASKITMEGVEKTLKEWTKRKVGERLASRLNVAEKTERLAVAMQEADHWLEFSKSSAEILQQVLSIGSSLGVPADAASLDGLIEGIASLRTQLAEATGVVESIHQRTAAAGEGKSLRERIEQAARLAVRVVATLGSIDSRLKEFQNRLSQTQEDLQELKTKTLRWILAVTIAVTLLIVWMAAGQIALSLLAFKGLRRTAASPSVPDPTPKK